ncbi:MAG: copper resistance protein CopB [Tistrella sp.]|uniref:copper resistance protein B n=1 Tax=Tistrella sp. TaxID=2024861 RepID=UPI000C575B69|nr:copper resistance protein B [Tistrella sp.]MAD38246.1 copper resistance protein CopB [Tistrella sp.]MBA76655.1 copper resistance protein CopB [Tistrella sp.]
MRILPIALAASLVAVPAMAQHAGHTPSSPPAQETPAADPHAGHGTGTAPATKPPSDPHAGHDMRRMEPASPATPTDPNAGHDMGGGSSSAPPEAPPPADAFSGPRHAADVLFDPSAMDEARERLRRDQGAIRSYRVMIDQLETRVRDGRDGYLWDAQGWYGGDIDKLWVKTEGEGTFGERTEQAEVQALWSRAITPWFDVQAGARYDVRPDPERGYAVFGLQGLVPYMFELDTAAFVSNEGDVSARLEGEYELLITQRLILQPRAEINLAVQEVRELGIGSGVNDVELGLRLRYEFAREFAPYIGVNWERKLGETADFARDDGESVDDLSFVAGVRLWF